MSAVHKVRIGNGNRGKAKTDAMKVAAHVKALEQFGNIENRKKISNAVRGKWKDPDFRAKMMVALNKPAVRKRRSETAKRQWSNPDIAKKMVEHNVRTHVERYESYCGKNSHLWQGGIAYLPYSPEWTRRLKHSVRERDNYTCQVCGALQEEVVFPVHHIDYDKKNCVMDNLVTLCPSCHSKTNSNREYWKTWFGKYLVGSVTSS